MRWVWSLTFLFLSVLSIASALDDSGSSVADLFVYTILILTLIFGLITFFSWRKTYKTKRNLLNLMFLTFPFLTMTIYLTCFIVTYHKIHKPYFLHATLYGDHRYDFYFRNDSTLKIVGHFLLNDVQTFQYFQMNADTIIIDKTSDSSEFKRGKYVFSFSRDSVHLLTPVNAKGQKLDSMSLYIEERK